MRTKRKRPTLAAAALDLSSVPKKVQVTLRMDEDLVTWLRALGPGWTTRVNRLLRVAYNSQRTSR